MVSALKEQARKLRAQGKTYLEIRKYLGDIPKSTLAYWCRSIILPSEYRVRVKTLVMRNLVKARLAAQQIRENRHNLLLRKLDFQNKKLFKLFKRSTKVKKTVLAVLYLAEGSKTKRGYLMFGNSDPGVVSLFVKLLRKCYKIEEPKFRCTLQCRADQDIKRLERFWSEVTRISLRQFYKARVDRRTVGQVSRKKDYKGVCRIDYFSSSIDKELKYLGQRLMGL